MIYLMIFINLCCSYFIVLWFFVFYLFLSCTTSSHTLREASECQKKLLEASSPNRAEWVMDPLTCPSDYQCAVGLSSTNYDQSQAYEEAFDQARSFLLQSIRTQVRERVESKYKTTYRNGEESTERIIEKELRRHTEHNIRFLKVSDSYWEIYQSDTCKTYYKYWLRVSLPIQEYDRAATKSSRARAFYETVREDAQKMVDDGAIFTGIRSIADAIQQVAEDDPQSTSISFLISYLSTIIDGIHFRSESAEEIGIGFHDLPISMDLKVNYTRFDGKIISARGLPVRFRVGYRNDAGELNIKGFKFKENTISNTKGLVSCVINHFPLISGKNSLYTNKSRIERPSFFMYAFVSIFDLLRPLRATLEQPWRNEITDVIHKSRQQRYEVAFRIAHS